MVGSFRIRTVVSLRSVKASCIISLQKTPRTVHRHRLFSIHCLMHDNKYSSGRGEAVCKSVMLNTLMFVPIKNIMLHSTSLFGLAFLLVKLLPHLLSPNPPQGQLRLPCNLHHPPQLATISQALVSFQVT